jgi:hypothetical protein
MSDPNTPWNKSGPQSSGCGSFLLMLLGLVMLLPGVCAIFFIVNDPKVLLPNAGAAGPVWFFLAIAAGGVALIWAAIGGPRGR